MTASRFAAAASIAACVGLAGCPLPHTDPPERAPEPSVVCRGCGRDASMADVLAIETNWSSTCYRSEPLPLTDTHTEDEREWRRIAKPCDEQPYRVEITCDVPCKVSLDHGEVSARGRRLNAVTPLRPGPLRVTTVLRHGRTGRVYRQTSEPTVFVAIEQIELVCLGPTGVFAACAEQPLDSANPVISVAMRRDGHWEPLDATLAHAGANPIEPWAGAVGDLAGFKAYSLADVLDVHPLPAGRYEVQVYVLDLTLARWAVVAASR